MKIKHSIKLSQIVSKHGHCKPYNRFINYDTLIVDAHRSFWYIKKKKIYKNFENIVFDYDSRYGGYIIDTTNTNIKNIVLSKRNDLNGITIDYDTICKNDEFFALELDARNFLIDTINIVFEDKVEKIKFNAKNRSSITFCKEMDDIELRIYSKEEDVLYTINNSGVKIVKKDKIRLFNRDVKDGVLDLCKFDEYKNIYLDNINIPIKTLIMNTNTFKNTYPYKLKVNELKFIDDNDMRLLPRTKTININGTLYFIDTNIDYQTLFVESDENKIINLYKNGDVQIIDKNYIEKNFPNIKKWEIFKGYHRCIAIIEHNKKNKFTFFINNKRYEINSGFKRYLMLNNNKFNELLVNNDWSKIFKSGLSNSDFDELYTGYLKYMDKLKQLKDLGISNKTLYYAYAIDFDKNKDLKYFKGIKEMIDCFDGKEEAAKAIEECGKILIKNIK